MGVPFDGAADVIFTEKDGVVRCSGFYIHRKMFHHRDKDLYVKLNLDGINGWETLKLRIPLRRLIEKHRSGVPSYIPDSSRLSLIYSKLREGPNDVSFYLEDEPMHPVNARIYRYQWSSNLIFWDFDGTITGSEKRGMIVCHLGRRLKKVWTREHVTELLCLLEDNNYKIIYLTQRPMSMKDLTCGTLTGHKSLPDGPVITSCDGRLHLAAKHVEGISHDAFKIPYLERIKELFHEKAFCAGFGDRDTDSASYRAVGIPLIFHIEKDGTVRVDIMGQNEAVQSISSQIYFPSYKNVAGFINKLR